MAEQLDVYRDWLKVSDADRPLNYYQLLRVPKFEDSAEKVREHYRKLNVHVRKYASGQYAAQSQQLLNELAKAMLCLTDARRKREYDASLGRETTGEGKRRTFEEVLLANKLIDQDQLAKARNYAKAVNMDIRDAVLQQKLAPPEAVMLAFAESEGLPYVELEDVGVDEQLVPHIPPSTARQHSCVPVMADDGQLLMASPNPLIPDVEEDLRLRLNMPVRTVLCTPASVNVAIAKHYPRDMPEPVPVAANSTPKKGKEKKKAAPKEEFLTPQERNKRSGMFALIAFNIAVVLTILVRWLLAYPIPLSTGQMFVAALIAVVLGGVIGGATFVLAKNMKL
jgi:hypothetical protein